jgi:hypothetical protein
MPRLASWPAVAILLCGCARLGFFAGSSDAGRGDVATRDLASRDLASRDLAAERLDSRHDVSRLDGPRRDQSRDRRADSPHLKVEWLKIKDELKPDLPRLDQPLAPDVAKADTRPDKPKLDQPSPDQVKPVDQPAKADKLAKDLGAATGKWIAIQAGTFTMGAPAGEPCGLGSSETAHTVELTHPFEIWSTEVTRVQLRAARAEPRSDRLVLRELGQPDPRSRAEEAPGLGPLRHGGQPLGVVSRLVDQRPRGCQDGEPVGRGHGDDAGDARRIVQPPGIAGARRGAQRHPADDPRRRRFQVRPLAVGWRTRVIAAGDRVE